MPGALAIDSVKNLAMDYWPEYTVPVTLPSRSGAVSRKALVIPPRLVEMTKERAYLKRALTISVRGPNFLRTNFGGPLVQRKPAFLCVVALAVVLGASSIRSFAQTSSSPVGMFEGHGDVGTVLHAGSTEYDASKQTYTLTGSGTNMWLGEDDFQFAWKKMSGDVSLTADISFPHRGRKRT